MAAIDLNLAGAFVNGRNDGMSNTVLLGVRLRPFSIWHRVLLKTVDSPFITGQRVTLWDFRVAAGICRSTFGRSRLSKPYLWAFLIHCLAFLRAFAWKDRTRTPMQVELERLKQAFADYTGDYLQTPEYSFVPPDTDGRPTRSRPPVGRAPDEIEQIGELIHWSGWSREVVWNLPIGEANWYRAMAQRSAGNELDFVDEREKAFRAKLPDEFRHRRDN